MILKILVCVFLFVGIFFKTQHFITVVGDSSKITIGGKTFAQVVTTLIKTLTPSVTYTNPTVTDSTGKACTVTGGGVTLSWS